MGDWQFFALLLSNGILIGLMYSLIALGFVLVYKATDAINFAQGEFVMLGGMTAVTLHQFLPMPLAILLAVVVTMIVGAVIEIVFIRWLYKPSVLRMVIITIGVSILIREIALHIWGNAVRALPYFTGSAISSINLGGVYVSSQVLWVVAIGAVAVAALTAFFTMTMLGRQMR
ncbi:MAG TPA: branched-chain amino acid ABC transporter permease, partial [Candidatus Rokubacteria bacterium]|nr:branched-chain amino acid ABC transporter permease [Candidatus Rokubacteria bacterium]